MESPRLIQSTRMLSPYKSILIAISFIVVSANAQKDATFETTVNGSLPENKNYDLPSSVTYASDASGHHYTISGLYSTYPEPSPTSSSFIKGFIPDCTKCDLDYPKKKLAFTTTRQISLNALTSSINYLAKLGYSIPYWLELEARDIPKSKSFNDKKYLVNPHDSDFPKGIAWISVPKNQKTSGPTRYKFSAPDFNMSFQGEYIIVPTKAHCMAHSCFSLRILDNEGKLLWEDTSTLYASTSLAIVDTNNDGIHEFFIDRNDHGTEARFHITPKQ